MDNGRREVGRICGIVGVLWGKFRGLIELERVCYSEFC